MNCTFTVKKNFFNFANATVDDSDARRYSLGYVNVSYIKGEIRFEATDTKILARKVVPEDEITLEGFSSLDTAVDLNFLIDPKFFKRIRSFGKMSTVYVVKVDFSAKTITVNVDGYEISTSHIEDAREFPRTNPVVKDIPDNHNFIVSRTVLLKLLKSIDPTEDYLKIQSVKDGEQFKPILIDSCAEINMLNTSRSAIMPCYDYNKRG